MSISNPHRACAAGGKGSIARMGLIFDKKPSPHGDLADGWHLVVMSLLMSFS